MKQQINKSIPPIDKLKLDQRIEQEIEFFEKPNKTAVAISYDPEDVAPKIIASGKGYLAEKMIHAAKEHDVPVHKDIKLANTMSKLEVGDFIPKELYEVVSEILVFVDKMDNLKKKLEL